MIILSGHFTFCLNIFWIFVFLAILFSVNLFYGFILSVKLISGRYFSEKIFSVIIPSGNYIFRHFNFCLNIFCHLSTLVILISGSLYFGFLLSGNLRSGCLFSGTLYASLYTTILEGWI